MQCKLEIKKKPLQQNKHDGFCKIPERELIYFPSAILLTKEMMIKRWVGGLANNFHCIHLVNHHHYSKYMVLRGSTNELIKSDQSYR